MSTPQSPRDSEVISLRTSADFKNRLREWADGRGIPMSRLLEEMGELYARAEAGAERKLSAVELLLRPHFQTIERELSRAFDESEGKGNLFREEAEALRGAADRAELRHKEERAAWEIERQSLREKADTAERTLATEREARVVAERQAREATDTARALTTSLSEARNQIEELKVQVVGLPALRKERDAMSAESHKLAVERESAELSLARVREDFLREKEAVKRGDDAHSRELQAMEREFEARVAKAQLDLERSHLQKTAELERQIQTLQGQVSRLGEGTTP